MKRIFFLVGVSLFILGCGLILGSSFLFNQNSIHDAFNQNSIRDECHFSSIAQTWKMPHPPLELSEGDTLSVEATGNGEGTARIYIWPDGGEPVLLETLSSGNWSGKYSSNLYYNVQTHDFYYIYVELDAIGLPRGLDMSLNVTVTQEAPDLLFSLLGGFFVLVGAVLTPIAFFYNSKPREE